MAKAPVFTTIDSVNGAVRSYEHDALKVTDAEDAALVTPLSYAYEPGNVKRGGASSASSSAANKAALQEAITANARNEDGAAFIVVPADINYGYDIDDVATHPDFSGTTAPQVVIDYGPGDSYAGFPASYDGAQVRVFFHTPQTTATTTFTGTLLSSATSATLSGNWPGLTGKWPVTFSNGDERDVTFTNGATTATWTTGLTAAATATFTYVNPGQHVGNTYFIRAAWAPGIFIVNDANLAAAGAAARLAMDNRRAQLSFGSDGLEGWKIGQGTLTGPSYTNEELSNFAVQKVELPGDTLGSFGCWIIERKTLNQSFGAATNEPPASFHFNSPVTGFYQAMFENTFGTESSFLLRNNVGVNDDCGVANKAGVLSLFIRATGDALLINKTTRRVTFAAGIQNKFVTLTYGTAVGIDASEGSIYVVTATDGVAFAINAPTNPITGARICITIKNTSGGALGTCTFNAVFKMPSNTPTMPANAFQRTFHFYNDNVNWISEDPGVDVPN